MYKLILVVASVTVAFGQPAVFTGGVRNAASARSGLPNPGIAPGAWFAIQGKNLGPASAVRADTPALSLGGTSVLASAGGQQFEVPLSYVSAGEIIARLPAGVPVGEASLTIQTAAGSIADAAKFNVVESSFGLLTTNQSDDAAAVARDFFNGASFALNSLPAAAKPGDEVNLWGTGLGSENANIEVTIQDKAAEVIARVPGENGIDRIRVRVPDSADGCGVPLVLKTGDARNPVGLLSVAAAGRVCLDQNGFTPEDFDKARSAGGLKAAYLFLMRFGVPGGGVLDMGFANFSRVSYDRMNLFRSNWAQTVPGACYAANTDNQGTFTGQGQPGAEFFDDFYPFGETPLDAGPMINVRGPGGPQQMQKVDNGFYTGLFLNFMNPTVPYFAPGDYTLEGSGGEVGGFSANVKIGSPVVWQNIQPQASSASINVPRGEDLKLTWTGGNPGDRVWIAAYAMETNGISFVRAGVVSCYELAEKGSMTIPASALQFLPATNQEGAGFLLLYSMAAPQRFQPSGGGLDAGYVLSLSYSMGLANFR